VPSVEKRVSGPVPRAGRVAGVHCTKKKYEKEERGDGRGGDAAAEKPACKSSCSWFVADCIINPSTSTVNR